MVIEKRDTAEDGDIVVALGDGNGSSLKRLLKKRNKYVLHPENDAMSDIVVQELRIQGEARYLIKKL